MKNFKDGLEQEITEKIYQRILYHRNRFSRLFFNRYLELLPLTIGYENIEDNLIDQIKLELILRQGRGAAIGQLSNGKIGLLGYIINKYNQYDFNSVNYVNKYRFTKNDINFIISRKLRCKNYIELSDYDDFETGNFVVLWNKPKTFTNDFEIVNHYTDELTEIIVSRYSIIMQSKINTFLRDEFGSEDLSEIASDLYNGKPYIKTTSKFDVEEHIINISNTAFVSALAELKRTYQNIIAELNSMLGLNSLGVDKESGVSNVEAQSNRSFKKANENIYLRARNEPLEKLNHKFGTSLHAEYYDSMITQLSSLEKVEVITE